MRLACSCRVCCSQVPGRVPSQGEANPDKCHASAAGAGPSWERHKATSKWAHRPGSKTYLRTAVTVGSQRPPLHSGYHSRKKENKKGRA